MTSGARRTSGEFELIARWFERPVDDPGVLLGVGDDAALVEADATLAVATDMLVEGVHFLPSIAPRRLGHRALAVNLSDMAAMGARPRWFTLALSLPQADAAWVAEFAEGLHACAGAHGVSLIGGDTTSGPLCICIQMIGDVPQTLALKRSGAGIGDAIYVTGTLGDAAAGLELAQQAAADGELPEPSESRQLLDRYEIPTPRIEAGLALRGLASAAIDVSDGLVADLSWICAASDCAATIEVERLPLSTALQNYAPQRARTLALSGGDDYELCFTAPADAPVEEAFAALDVPVTRIGTCTSGEGVRCVLDGVPMDPGKAGFEHFR